MTFSSLNSWLSCHVSSLMHNHYDGWIYFVTVRSSLTTVSVLLLLCRIHVLMCAHCVYDFFMPHSWTFFVLVVVCLVSICRCGLLCGFFSLYIFYCYRCFTIFLLCLTVVFDPNLKVYCQTTHILALCVTLLFDHYLSDRACLFTGSLT